MPETLIATKDYGNFMSQRPHDQTCTLDDPGSTLLCIVSLLDAFSLYFEGESRLK